MCLGAVRASSVMDMHLKSNNMTRCLCVCCCGPLSGSERMIADNGNIVFIKAIVCSFDFVTLCQKDGN